MKDGENGLVFSDSDELAAHLIRLFGEQGVSELEKLRNGAHSHFSERWNDQWGKRQRLSCE